MLRHLKPTVLLLLVACGGDRLLDGVASRTVTSGELHVNTIFALPPFTDAPLPVYFTVENTGSIPDTLLGASSTSSGSVRFHGAAMADLSLVPIPAGATLSLRPGGLHLMLEPPLDRDYQRGDSLSVTLRFARAGTLTLHVPVIAYAEADAVLPPATGPPAPLP